MQGIFGLPQDARLGVYRFWRIRDATGAVAGGVLADYLGMKVGFWLIAGLMPSSGLVPLFGWEQTHREKPCVR